MLWPDLSTHRVHAVSSCCLAWFPCELVYAINPPERGDTLTCVAFVNVVLRAGLI